MGRHDPVHWAHELPPDEDDGHGGGPAGEAHEPGEGPLHVGPAGVLVELVDGGVDPHPAEEALDGVAHAARADAEDDDGALGGEALDALEGVGAGGGGDVRGPGVGGGGGVIMHCWDGSS